MATCGLNYDVIWCINTPAQWINDVWSFVMSSFRIPSFSPGNWRRIQHSARPVFDYKELMRCWTHVITLTYQQWLLSCEKMTSMSGNGVGQVQQIHLLEHIIFKCAVFINPTPTAVVLDPGAGLTCLTFVCELWYITPSMIAVLHTGLPPSPCLSAPSGPQKGPLCSARCLWRPGRTMPPLATACHITRDCDGA